MQNDGSLGTKSQPKYTPPHRRKVKSHNPQDPSQQFPFEDHQESSSNSPSIPLTQHARMRKSQRDISGDAIHAALQDGEKLPQPSHVVSLDETTKVVATTKGSVITVSQNKRNTSSDLLRVNANQEKRLIKKATYGNNDHAMCELAELYLSGTLGNREPYKALEWLLKAADKGNSHAMCLVSQLYEDDDLGKSDPQKASEWMEKAAHRNNSYALAIVGQRALGEYLKVRHSPRITLVEKKKLLDKAKLFLEKGAKKGSTRAMWQLAQLYEKGWLGERNLSKAIELYVKAANLGSPASLDSLNTLVLKGEFESEHFEALLEKASQLITRTSANLVVEIALKQMKGKLGKNPQRGFGMIKTIAQRKGANHAEAIRLLAKCYREGLACEPDEALAKHWFLQLKALYEKAAHQGNVDAMHALVDLLLSGEYGWSIDFEAARTWLIQAAKTGDIASIIVLGRFYVEGRLGDHDPSEGIPWIQQAIDYWTPKALSGDSEALEGLIDLYQDPDLGFKDYSKVIEWLLLRSEKGHPEAKLSLAEMYFKRSLGTEDFSSAIHWIEQLIEESTEEIEPKGLKAKALALLKKHLMDDSPTVSRLSQEKQNFKALWSSKAIALETKVYQELYQVLSDSDDAQTIDIDVLQALVNIDQSRLVVEAHEHQRLKQWLQKSEAILQQRAETEGDTALLLGKLYQRGDLVPRKLVMATHFLCRASCLAETQDISVESIARLDQCLHFKAWSLEEKRQILDGLLQNQFYEEKPYRVGRILGDVYSQGILVDIDYSRAISWYKKAAEFGNGTAMSRLGTLCAQGLGGPKDISQAAQWYRSSFQNGYEESITLLKQLQVSESLNLSLTTPSEGMLVSGVTLRLNPHPSSAYEMYYLAEVYREGNQQICPDPVLAAYWFRRSLQAGREQSTLALGDLYASGALGSKVRSVALHFYKQMAEKGDLEAIKKLLALYQEGVLTSKTDDEVTQWQIRLEKTLISEDRQKWLKSRSDFRICAIPLKTHDLLEAVLMGARQAHVTIPDSILSMRGLVVEAFDIEEVPVALETKRFLLLKTMAQILKICIELYGTSISKDSGSFVVQYGSKTDDKIESLGSINPESGIIIHILQRDRNRYNLLLPTEQGLRHYYDRMFSARPILDRLKKELALSQDYSQADCKPSNILRFSNDQAKAKTEEGTPKSQLKQKKI